MSILPKYILVSDCEATRIDDDEELNVMLHDGSMDEGDEVYEVKRRLIVKTTTTYSLEEEMKGGE